MAFEFDGDVNKDELGIFRLEIDGNWSTQDFAKLLQDISECYSTLNTLYFISHRVERETAERERLAAQENTYPTFGYFSELAWRVLNPERVVFGDSRRGSREIAEPINPEEALKFLTSVAQRYSGDLSINSIEYSSPGWLEVIGNLNPLKVISDFMTNWRKENTERTKNEQQAKKDERKDDLDAEKMKSEERIEREKFQSQERIEMAKVKSDFAKALLESGKPLRGMVRPDNLERLLGVIDSTTVNKLSEIAKDTRVGNVKLLPPSSEN